MTFDSIVNRGEFFSNHYLDAVIGGDLGDLRGQWDALEAKGEPTSRSRIRSMPAAFFTARAGASETSRSNRAAALQHLNDIVLTALGFRPARTEWELKRNTEHLVTVPVATHVETGTGLLLLAIEAGLAESDDDLASFDDARRLDTEQPGELLRPLFRHADNNAVFGATEAVGEIFSTDDPPRYVLVLGGRVVLLAERGKWAEGRYLAVDLDAALERNDSRAKGELEMIAALFSADAIVPGGLDGTGGQSVLDDLVDKSNKHAVGVSKELRNGIRESIEIIANEVIEQRDNRARAQNRTLFTRTDVDAKALTRQSLRYLYRLLVLLYAESRPELGILPVRDQDYLDGYSLDRLRELCLVELTDDHARNGSHLNDSLDLLFRLVNDGYNAETAVQQMRFTDGDDPDGDVRSDEEYLQFPGLDAALFDPASTDLINRVTLRNEALQQVLRNLMLAKGKSKRDSAGFISYAQLGINQLGAVYEGLMAYTGFYADRDLYEVAKHGDPSDGTWMLPVEDADDYPDDVFVTRVDDLTGKPERVRHAKGSFVFRLSGRDRQRSASYYTPEVLTRCVVKHALAELLGLDDYAPENGSSGITRAAEILELTICEPALGSGAFANEAINQLSAEYLKRAQAERGETLDPDRYLRELQKVKAHFALHQTYGVDLNATAIELAEVSLWLNCMYPGLKAPWFGMQLRAGNSLVGCRRATWKVSQLGDRPWAQTTKAKLQPPVDRKRTDELMLTGPGAEIHHFLLPGHGWAAVAERSEAKELRPDEVKGLKEWRKAILSAPTKADAERLTKLAAGVEALWAAAAEQIEWIQKRLRRNIDVYGADARTAPTFGISRGEAEQLRDDPDSPLGRLRTLMDAWVGLWFWPLDTGEAPPTWGGWLQVAEDLIRPDERHGLTGQLDLFADLQSLVAEQEMRKLGQTSVAELRQLHSWLAVAVDTARREGAWHWDLEFAPVFGRGGFDLQVGNPPWVRLDWTEDLIFAEYDPWWGVVERMPSQTRADRRREGLTTRAVQAGYIAELAAASATGELVGSAILRSILAGVRTNLYMVFMDTTWRHANSTGAVGLLHPEGHFTDPGAGNLRRECYKRLRRHAQFRNELGLFDIGNTREFGIHVSGLSRQVLFTNSTSILHPSTLDGSFQHSGHGPIPGLQFPEGGWDLRPHKDRVIYVTESVLRAAAALFDEPGTPALDARLPRLNTTADLATVVTLASTNQRLSDHPFHWTQAWNETTAKEAGHIHWETGVPESLEDAIIQGADIWIASPLVRQPADSYKSFKDVVEIDLETLPTNFVPRTNYKRSSSIEDYAAAHDSWNGVASSNFWRILWRRRCDSGMERTLISALYPPGPSHVDSVLGLGSSDIGTLVATAGAWSSLVYDYLVRLLGKDVRFDVASRLPLLPTTPLLSPISLRTLRLNCTTGAYGPLWQTSFDSRWTKDSWTDAHLSTVALGEIEGDWSESTPLRFDAHRRMALVELDSLVALALGLDAKQLCDMYRTQFAVLRKYEHRMVFDAEGRKICGDHHSAGFKQRDVQDQAKAGNLPKEWTNVWRLFERYEDDPDSVDWLGIYKPPFHRPDREAEMKRAYNEFQRRLDAGEYGTVVR